MIYFISTESQFSNLLLNIPCAVIGYMKTFALDDESSRWIKNHSYITVMRIRCRDINLVNVWLWENFVLPNVRTDVVQSQKMSNKLKIILSEEERTRSIYRFSEDTTTFECMKGDIWENPSRDGENVKNATKFNQSQLSKKKPALTHFFAQDEKNNVHILGQGLFMTCWLWFIQSIVLS